MKIQKPPTIPTITPPAAPPIPEKNPAASPPPDSSLEQQIYRWFGRAGVQPRAHQINRTPEQQVSRRRAVQEHNKLNNLQAVMQAATQVATNEHNNQQLDADWFFSFTELAEHIYTPSMQELWGKILAVELTRPGSFSLTSLQLLKGLTQKDAQIFQRACRLASRKQGGLVPKILIGYQQKPNLIGLLTRHKPQQLNLGQFGLPYPDLLTLMELGLIYRSEIESAELSKQADSEWRYAGYHLHIRAKNNGCALSYYKFTHTGAELARLINHKPRDDYWQALQSNLHAAFKLHVS